MADTPLRSRWQLPAALVGVALGALFATFLTIAILGQAERTDFMVYRGSVQSMLAGGSLYTYELDAGLAQTLPFTYPPFAGLVLAPIGMVPLPAGLLAWTLLGLVCCVVAAWIVWRALPAAGIGALDRRLGVAVAAVALLVSEPVTHGISLGQVSLPLVVLVLLDLVVPPRWRGLLVGLAAAIKLIPLVFLPYYLFTRQWRAARNLGFGFLGAIGVAFLVLPGDSVKYWTDLVLSTGRIGETSSRRNKSLLGLLTHLGMAGTPLQVAWLVLCLVITGFALWRAVRHFRRGEELAAVLVVGLLSAVVSPISWPHHLAWAAVAAVYLVLARPGWTRWVGVVVWFAFVVNTPLMGFDDAAPAWMLLPEGLLTLCLIALAVFGFPSLPARAGEPAEQPERSTPAGAA